VDLGRLETVLLSVGGSRVDTRWGGIWDQRILTSGREDIVELPTGHSAYACLRSELAIVYYLQGRMKKQYKPIMRVGYGLLGDGVWRRHVWSIREVTNTLRLRYFGVPLTRPEIIKWLSSMDSRLPKLR
jgi:hypothetical protein